jgi:putative aldouronate transport system substrate-binding protein
MRSGNPGISRRLLFKAAGAAGAVAAAPTLIGCSSTKSGSVSSAGKDLASWPTYMPAKVSAPDLPGSAAGVQPGYLKYPTDLVTSVPTKPGDGSDVTALVITYEPPPAAVSSNKLWAAINQALAVNLKLNLVPGDGFIAKMAAIEAGNDLPDILLATGTVPNQSSFVQAKCQDLTDFLSGDNIKKYPNLANLPSYAWQGMGRIGGRIYGIPIPRPRAGNILMANQSVLAAVGGLSTWDSDQFAKEMAAVTSGRRWGFGANSGSQWGLTYHGPSWSLPNNWKVDGGTFTNTLADPRFKDVLNYMRGLYQAGVYYPDAATSSGVDLKTLFYNQTIAADPDGFVAYHTAIPAVKGKFVVDFGRPYKVNGTTSVWYSIGYFGYTALKKAPKARIEMLLRILDFLAAPFGSKEYELNHFGVEGQHFTRDPQGQIVPTALADKENPDTVPIRYIADAPTVTFYPGDPDAAKRQHDYDSAAIPLGVPDPSAGLHSDTYDRTQAKLIQIENDGVAAIVTGRQPVSSWDGVLTQWKQAGGAASATEFAKEHAAQS